MTDTELLMTTIRDKGMSLAYVANKMNLSRYGLYKKIHNQSYFNIYEVDQMCKLLSIKSMKDKERIFFAK